MTSIVPTQLFYRFTLFTELPPPSPDNNSAAMAMLLPRPVSSLAPGVPRYPLPSRLNSRRRKSVSVVQASWQEVLLLSSLSLSVLLHSSFSLCSAALFPPIEGIPNPRRGRVALWSLDFRITTRQFLISSGFSLQGSSSSLRSLSPRWRPSPIAPWEKSSVGNSVKPRGTPWRSHWGLKPSLKRPEKRGIWPFLDWLQYVGGDGFVHSNKKELTADCTSKIFKPVLPFSSLGIRKMVTKFCHSLWSFFFDMKNHVSRIICINFSKRKTLFTLFLCSSWML